MDQREHPRPGDDAAETVAAGGLLLPGGKVDPQAILDAIELAGEDEDEGLRTVRFEIRRDLDKRLDKYLTDRISFMSRNQLQRLIDEGGVTVNGRPPKASTKIGAGDVVEVVVPPPPPKGTQPEDIPLDILFEDEHMLVLNKRPGIITHPARSHQSGTLINALAFHFRNRSPHGGDLSGVGAEFARPGVVHRLDRDTSGVMVFAKTDEAHWKLGHQFEHRRVDKRYLTIAHGRLEPASDVIDLPIGPHPSREKGYREKHVVRHDELGKQAITVYRVREWYDLAGPIVDTAPQVAKPAPGWTPPPPTPTKGPFLSRTAAPSQKQFSLVEIELKTGRTHQIRVHLSHSGWPIVGDDMYGGQPYLSATGETIIERQALHAAMLAFHHPITGKEMVYTAPFRGDMAALVADLRSRGSPRRLDPKGTVVDLDKAVAG